MSVCFKLLCLGLLCSGCVASTGSVGRDCSDELLALWQIPSAWISRSLSPEQASLRVHSGNLPIDEIRERWQTLEALRKVSDQYWLYRRPEGQWINPTGAEEGVVLLRGCQQLGFVTTSMAAAGS